MKRVEERREKELEKETVNSGGHDVAAILQRRIVMEMSDSEDSHASGGDDFEDNWSD